MRADLSDRLRPFSNPHLSEASTPADLDMLDVSMVVNIHAGAPFLARTMRSLEASAVLARQGGQRVELLLVLDNSPPDTIAWVAGYRSEAFERIRILFFAHGSLAHSRQAGLEAARADYVQFCDEDDLISANTTYASYRTARALGPKAIVIPEYSLGFGAQRFLAVYEGSGPATPLQMFSSHPFVSRLFLHRSILDQVRYGDIRLGAGYAYEDWHFNAQALAAGYTFAVAPRTILFYRHRARSLLANMDRKSARLIPPNDLFEPQRFLAVARVAARRLGHSGQAYADPTYERDRFCLHPENTRAVAEANAIEPAIDATAIGSLPVIAMKDADQRPGVAYFQACRRIGGEQFTDIALAESQAAAEGVSAVLHSLASADPSRRSLLLVENCLGELASPPLNTIVIDLQTLGADADTNALDTIALRLIESSPGARLHFTAGVFGGRILGKFGALLGGREIIAHRVPASVRLAYGRRARIDPGFDMVSEHLEILSRVISPSNTDKAFDIARLDRRTNIWSRLYQPRATSPSRPSGAAPNKRMLALAPAGSPFEVWRIEQRSGARIDVLSTLTEDTPWADYDALLLLDPDAVTYTELEAALRAGVPLLSERRGALDELLYDGSTGLVVPDAGWEAAARETAHVDTIARMVVEPGLQASLAKSALAFVAARHGAGPFREAAIALLGYTQAKTQGGAA